MQRATSVANASAIAMRLEPVSTSLSLLQIDDGLMTGVLPESEDSDGHADTTNEVLGVFLALRVNLSSLFRQRNISSVLLRSRLHPFNPIAWRVNSLCAAGWGCVLS